jgi:hypothetical protein
MASPSYELSMPRSEYIRQACVVFSQEALAPS